MWACSYGGPGGLSGSRARARSWPWRKSPMSCRELTMKDVSRIYLQVRWSHEGGRWHRAPMCTSEEEERLRVEIPCLRRDILAERMELETDPRSSAGLNLIHAVAGKLIHPGRPEPTASRPRRYPTRNVRVGHPARPSEVPPRRMPPPASPILGMVHFQGRPSCAKRGERV